MAFWNPFSKNKKESQETLDKGLEKTKEGIFSKIKRALASRSTIDDDFLDELEEILITSDLGTDTTFTIIERLRDRVSRDKYVGTDELNDLLYDEVAKLMADVPDGISNADFTIPADKKPYVILVVGVNGAGKTTTIGKLAYQFKEAGNKVVLGAADTYRAAAIEQLEEWSRRAGVQLVKQKQGSDPAAVAYDTAASGKAQNADVIIIDTAGRLHNRVDLMNELTKIKRSVDRIIPGAPHEVLLVLDGSTGQNAIEQARQFSAATQVTGLVVTKLDGTAKGGVVIGISNEHRLPVRYIGLGEKITDLQPFDKMAFVKTLFDKNKNAE